MGDTRALRPPTQEFVIRPFCATDQPATKALILAGLGEHFGFIDESLNPDLNDIAASYPAQTATFIVAIDRHNQIVGTAALIEENSTTGRLVRMSVAPASRGNGLARQLLATLEDAALQRGYSKLVCETNHDWDDAVGLYRSSGFSETGILDGDRHFVKMLQSATAE